MAVQVVFYKFGKKINSTKRPDAETESVTYSCNMLDDCSIINPKISIAGSDNTFNPSIYNYAYIASYDSRYYYVSDWTYSQGLWIASLTEDVLASWRGNIGTSSQYILRAASTSAVDWRIADANYPTESRYTNQNTYSKKNPFVTSVNSGTVVLGTIGNDPSKTTTVTAANYYAMTPAAFTFFVNTFLSSTEFVAQVVTGLLNPIEYIVSCQWFPIAYSDITGTEEASTIYLGWWPVPQQVASKKLVGDSVTHTISTTYNLPKHPDTTDKGAWVNMSPFTNRYFVWPPIGVIPLDTTIIGDYEPCISVIYYVDLISGGATYEIISGTTTTNCGNCLFGVNLPITQSGVDMSAILNNATSASLNIAAGNYVGFAGNVINGVSQAIPQYEKSGSISSFSSFISGTPFVRSDFVSLPEHSVETYGKPSYKYLKINTLSGYIQTGNAHLEIAATDTEIDQIISYMNGGFYYE